MSPRPIVYDFVEDHARQTVADALGVARMNFNGPAPFRLWEITGIALDSNSGGSPQCTVYRNVEVPNNIIAFTRLGLRDTARGRVFVRYGEIVIAVFTAATVGSRCSLTITVRNRPSV